MEERRTAVAIVAALGVFLALSLVVRWLSPPKPPPPATTQPAVAQSAPAPGPPGPSSSATSISAAPASAASQAALRLDVQPEAPPIILGEAQDELRLELRARGAAIAMMQLTERLPKRDRYRFRAELKGNEPCTVLAPIKTDTEEALSYDTPRLWLSHVSKDPIDLRGVNWHESGPQRDANGARASFTTTVQTDQGSDLIALEKTYRIVPGKPIVILTVTAHNLSNTDQEVILGQDGPVGIELEDNRTHIRRILGAVQKAGQGLTFGLNAVRREVWTNTHKNPEKPEPAPIAALNDPNTAFAWTAICNKYFGVFTRPLVEADGKNWIATALSDLVIDNGTTDAGDLRLQMVTRGRSIAPGKSTSWSFEIYAGAKDPQYLEGVNPAFADRSQLNYLSAFDVDQGSCMCVFHPLPEIMGWLMRTIAALVGNYGVAILGLVLIVRGLLHPLSVFQQKSMYRMQEAMSKLQPKLDAIKGQYPNDPQRQNQEMMRVYTQEGVNPAGMFVSFIPLFVQLPILSALWSQLNSAVALRHAPFDGWWIRDLAAPDAFLNFPGGVTIPVLSWIPLIGPIFTNIQSLNLLPIVMGVSMWLQQKYMPKPEHVKQAQEAKATKTGTSVEDQMRQQQTMAYMMSIMFPLMFYSQPAGLNIYWFFTTLVGIAESLIIRRQIKAEKEYRRIHGDLPKPTKKGFIGRLMEEAAKRVEAAQKEVERLKEAEKKQPPKRR